jgi:hypothetical protein
LKLMDVHIVMHKEIIKECLFQKSPRTDANQSCKSDSSDTIKQDQGLKLTMANRRESRNIYSPFICFDFCYWSALEKE